MAGQNAPVVDRIRIIPRPADFLDRNVGSSGEVFFNKATNSLRVYSGAVAGGYELAKSDLTNIANADFLSKAESAGVISAGIVDWDNINNKPTFATVSTTGSYTDLTNTPNLNIYATTDYVDSALASIPSNGGATPVNLKFNIAADDSTQREVLAGETIQFLGGTGITTTSDDEGAITISATSSTSFNSLLEPTTASLTIDKIYEPAIVMLRVDNVGTTSFTFPSHYAGNNPTIYALSGTTIAFDLDAIPSIPFRLLDNTLTPLSSGLIHVATDGTVSTDAAAQSKSSGTLYWRIPETESGTFVYDSPSYPAMYGTLSVKRFSLI